MTYKRYSTVTRICKKCDKYVPEEFYFPIHVKLCDGTGNSTRGHKVNSQIKQCEFCGGDFEIMISPGSRPKKNCSGECKRKSMSEKRKKFLADNPDSHPWRRPDNKISIPCENVKKYLSDRGIDFIPEYQPLDDRFFSIDIAFPHIKVGIEINGMQHYNSDGSLKPYYQERHDLISLAGWKLIEVFYTECFSDEKISKFLDFEIPKDEEGVLQYIRDKIAASKNKPITRERGVTRKMAGDAEWINKKDEIFKYGIDFNKFGWCAKVSKILGISQQHASRWMQRHHPEFYENHCFRRRPPRKDA
jgi:very-short-patch-repair endonuclease